MSQWLLVIGGMGVNNLLEASQSGLVSKIFDSVRLSDILLTRIRARRAEERIMAILEKEAGVF